MEAAIIGIAGLIAIPVIRQAIKSYRAKKSIAEIAVDAVEAAVDVIDKK
jgi:Tfp pilus assembly protein FimT